ncbi:MAG: glycosyltransferase family 4 protein [Anaerohalosphaera sp.]|nr:glycosyltransferase family 4 protein [Anaerohalosphaera sp.]
MPDEQSISSPVSASVKPVIRPALLVEGYTLRDYSTCLRNLFVGLNEKKYSAALVCPPGKGAESVICPNVELIRYPMFNIPLLYLQNRKLLIDSLAKFKPTVLHAISPGKYSLTKYLAHELQIPYVLTFNSQPKKRYNFVVTDKNCSSIIASSKTIAESISKTYRRCKEPIHQITIGTFVTDTCAAFSQTNNIPSIIVAQKLTNSAHFLPLLNAVRHLTIEGREFIIAIIGTGPAERDIYRHIRSMGLSNVITLVGNIRPLRRIFAQADIFVQPEPTNQFNSTLLEAMSVGMAVATSCQSKDDLIIENETAILFDQHDEISVYSTLQKLLDKREFARQLGKGAQAYLRKNHSVSNMTAAIENAYLTAQQRFKEKGVPQLQSAPPKTSPQ